MKLERAAIEALLLDWPVARLATVAESGTPNVVPIVFARDRDQIYSPVDGKPKSGRELSRVRNIRSRPLVSLVLDDYDSDWRRLWWLQIDGEARVIEPALPNRSPEIARAFEQLHAKYPQYEETPIVGEPPQLIAIRMTAMRSWCASSEAAPRVGHR
jgi:PPOX class probable F420-dependent enzyme